MYIKVPAFSLDEGICEPSQHAEESISVSVLNMTGECRQPTCQMIS